MPTSRRQDAVGQLIRTAAVLPAQGHLVGQTA